MIKNFRFFAALSLVGVSLGVPGAAWCAAGSAKELAIARAADDKELKWGPAPAFMPAGTQLTVLHGDPTKKNADVLLRFPAKSVIPNHYHSSAERMVLISGELRVKYQGQESILMKSGTYGYVPSKLKHDAVCESAEPCVLFIAFEGPVDSFPTAK